MLGTTCLLKDKTRRLEILMQAGAPEPRLYSKCSLDRVRAAVDLFGGQSSHLDCGESLPGGTQEVTGPDSPPVGLESTKCVCPEGSTLLG